MTYFTKHAELNRIVASLEANSIVVGCDIDPFGNLGVMIYKASDMEFTQELVKQAFAAENVEIEYTRVLVSGAYLMVAPKPTR